jgi:LysM repeat protein
MNKLKLPLIICFTLLSNFLFAQNSPNVLKYIDAFKDIAIAEMQRTGVPAAITLAQGIHETEAGMSDLVRASNNHFGIKCHGDWTGGKVFHDDDAKGECFRKYSDPADSYKDHSDFLKNRPNYAFLFRIDPTDFESWAWGLKKAGYATNPKYPQILIKLIRDYNLQDYTLIALNRKAPDAKDGIWASNTTTVLKPVRPAYPSGVFKINDTKVIFVSKGTALLKVAKEYDLSLGRLYEFNDMDPEDIASDDQLVYLQRKRKTGVNEFHIVEEGETVFDIAQSEGIRLETLLELNLLQKGMQPATGEKINLQHQTTATPKLVEKQITALSSFDTVTTDNTKLSDQVNNYILHTVQPRETMYAIARKYSVAVDDVMKWNDLQTIDLKTGQQLRISKRSMNGTN